MIFEISEKEKETTAKWAKEHFKKCQYGKPECQGASGGVLTFMLTPTTLGDVFKVKCACGHIEDCTDYESW